MQLTASDVLTFLLILAVVMLIIVLYHLIFFIVNVRKISERIDGITQEVEGMIMKPIQLLEESMSWITEFLMGMYEEKKSTKHKHHK